MLKHYHGISYTLETRVHRVLLIEAHHDTLLFIKMLFFLSLCDRQPTNMARGRKREKRAEQGICVLPKGVSDILCVGLCVSVCVHVSEVY